MKQIGFQSSLSLIRTFYTNFCDFMLKQLKHRFSFFSCISLFFSITICAITVSGVPGGTLVSMNPFSILCGWLVQRQGWRVKGWIWWSEQARTAKANSWLDYQRPLIKQEMGEGEMREILSIRPCGTSRVFFTCRKILRDGTFPLYFPSERKMCCGFL
jgi:hypothetical protein